MSSCRSCRCSTPTCGGWATPHPSRAPAWCCPAPTCRPARSPISSSPRRSRSRRAFPPSGWACCPRSRESFTDDGWLRTGDVAVIDPEGYIRLVDRTKDLVKSGGEWISSVELENELMAHPKVAEAAVIGVAHERWVERPLACVVLAEGEELTKEEIVEFLTPRVAKWWLPDDVVFIDEVPKTSVGKFSKKDLRERFAGYKLPT